MCRLGLIMAEDTSAESADSGTTGLVLIGMGPGGVSGMTLAAFEAAKSADHRRYEAYTALWPAEDLAELEAEVGEITRVMRPEVEKPEQIFELARNSKVALLVVGDPLQATTHVDLQLQAEQAGIPCEVIHGISITTLVVGHQDCPTTSLAGKPHLPTHTADGSPLPPSKPLH